MDYVSGYCFQLTKKDVENLLKMIEISSFNKIKTSRSKLLRASLEAFRIALESKHNKKALKLLEGK